MTCEKFGITDEEGRNFDALMCLPLNEELSSVHGKLVESPVYKECYNEEELRQLAEEFPDEGKNQRRFLML